MALVLVTFGWLARHRTRVSPAVAIAALVPIALLTSPRTWTHHTVALIVPIAIMTRIVIASRFANRFDAVALGAVLLLFTLSPVLQYGIELPSKLAHLLTPIPTYAAAATWLFMLVRLVPLCGGAPAARRPQSPRTDQFPSMAGLSTSARAT